MRSTDIITKIHIIIKKAGLDDHISISRDINEIADLMVYNSSKDNEQLAICGIPRFYVDDIANILYMYGDDKEYHFKDSELQIIFELAGGATYILEFGDEGIHEIWEVNDVLHAEINDVERSIRQYILQSALRRNLLNYVYVISSIYLESADGLYLYEDGEKEIRGAVIRYMDAYPEDIEFINIVGYESLSVSLYENKDPFGLKDIVRRLVKKGIEVEFLDYIRKESFCEDIPDNEAYMTESIKALTIIGDVKREAESMEE